MIVYRGISSTDVKTIRNKGLIPQIDTDKCYISRDGIDSSKIAVIHVTTQMVTACIYAYEYCYGKIITEATEKCTSFRASYKPEDKFNDTLKGGSPLLLKLNIPKKDLHTYDLSNGGIAWMITKSIPPEKITAFPVTASYRELHETTYHSLLLSTFFGVIDPDIVDLYGELSKTTYVDEQIKKWRKGKGVSNDSI